MAETSSTTIGQRIFAASGAIVFLLSSVALTVAVIISNIQDNHKKAAVSTASQTTKDGKLEGTKLAGFTPVSSVPELKTEDLQTGNGKEVTSANDTVTADYTGALAATGVIFQSSLDSGQPFTTQLTGVIEGWQKGMIGMKEGGKRRLLIPAAQAYGSQAQNGIPANSDLVFDITLHKVGQ
jgi:FKBP-type peptidyl-prolyl cis-trans isomerase